MKVIIAGSRKGTSYTDTKLAIQLAKGDGIVPTEIISGLANGPDTFGVQYGMENDIPVREFPADWDTYGKSAGFIRNAEMAESAEALIAIWDGRSRGTRDMIRTMRKANKPVYVHVVKPITTGMGYSLDDL